MASRRAPRTALQPPPPPPPPLLLPLLALLLSGARPAAAQTCGSAPALALAKLAALDGVLNVSWAPLAGAGVFGYRVSVLSIGAPPDAPSFGACSAPRNVTRVVAPDVTSATFLGIVAQAQYSVSVAPLLGASAESAAPCDASASAAATVTAARARLPTFDAPTMWLDAESFPTLGGAAGGAQQKLTAQLPDATGQWWWKLYGTTPATTSIALLPRAPMRAAKAFSFSGTLANDFLVPNSTSGTQASAADNAAFGWTTDADNTLTVVAAFQSLPTGVGGFVMGKGGYPYFADSGWNLMDYTNYMGLHAQLTTGNSGTSTKRIPSCPPGVANPNSPACAPRVDMAINYTAQDYQPSDAGVLTTFDLYRNNASFTNNSMLLDACLGVTTGSSYDECNNPGGEGLVTPFYTPWWSHITQDADVDPNTAGLENVVTWPQGYPLNTRGNKFPLAVGGGFYTSGSTGTTVGNAYPFAGYIYTAAVYRRRLSQTEKTAVQNFIADRYNLWCPALSVPGAVGGTDPLNANTCDATSAGSTCALTCGPGLVQVGGLTNLTCANGAWFGTAPVCAPAASTCAAPVHPAAATACALVLFADSFSRASYSAGCPAALSAAALLASAWETAPLLPPRLAATYWSYAATAAGGLTGSVPVADDNCSFTEGSHLLVNRPQSWAASVAASSAPLVIAATVTLDAGAAGGIAAQAAFAVATSYFPPGTPWGTDLAYPAYVNNAHTLARLTATGGAGAALEFVVNGAVSAVFPLPGVNVPARARAQLSLTVLPLGSPALQAALAAAGAAAGLQNMSVAGAAANASSSFVLSASVGGAPPLLVNVSGWPVGVGAGSSGVHMQLGRGGFANFSVSTSCPSATCSGLLPGQACVYAGGAAATCAPSTPTAASCGAAGAAAFVRPSSSVGLPPTASPSPTPTPSSTPSTTASLTATPSTTSTLTATPSTTPTMTASASVSLSSTPSATPTPSLSVGASASNTATTSLSVSFTSTPTPTPTGSPTPTPSTTPTMTATPSVSLSSTPSATPTPSLSTGASASVSATVSLSVSFTSTATASPTPSPTQTPSASPTGTQTPSTTASLSATPSSSVTPTSTTTPSTTASFSPSQTASNTPSRTASITASQTSSPSPTPSVTPVADILLSFSFSVTPSDGSTILNAGALAANAAVLSSIAANVASTVGVPASTVKVVNVTDIATGAVSRALGGSRRALAAAGTMGVSFTVVANLGKTASATSIAAKQAALVANFNATSPALRQIKADVAAAAGVSATSLNGVPPSTDSFSLAGATLPPAPALQAAQDTAGVLAMDEGIGAAVGLAIVALAFCLYAWRSKLVHGAYPWQRDRKREHFELKAKAARETEERLSAGSVEATVVSPLATAGKGALTVRVPKAVAEELRALRDEADAAKARDKLRVAELERLRALLAPAQAEEAGSAAAAAAAAAPATAAAAAATFAPVPVGGAAAAPQPAPPAAVQWVETRDPLSGRSYWFNRATRETTWNRPAGV